MPAFTIKPLIPSTWPDFSALVERHDGVWGGCWCLAFHPEGKEHGPHRREAKERRVREGTAHPEEVSGRTVSASFLYNSRRAMFERQGFERVRRPGKNHWVVSRSVEPKTSRDA